MNKRVLVSMIALTMAVNIGTTCLATDYSSQIKENKGKIESINKDKKALDEKIGSAEGELGPIEVKLQEQSDKLRVAEDNLKASNDKISDIESKLKDTENKIKEKEKEIKEVEKSIKKTEEELNKKTIMLGKRFRALYENGSSKNFLVFFLRMDSFQDFMGALSSFHKIAEMDNKIINGIKADKEKLQNDKNSLVSFKDTLENSKREQLALKAQLEEENKKLAEAKNIQQQAYDEVASIQKQKNDYIESLKNDKEALDEKIKDLESENKKLDTMMNEVVDNGASIGNSSGQSFDFPVDGPVTCPFGPRIHPITGKHKLHAGTDIGVPYNTPVRASKDGVVAEAGYQTAYGNMVILNHGSGYQTLYAHNTSLCVSPGQHVKKGQVIAYSGSTGWSTGPHCHFEVRHNGQAVSPF
ncbi:MAG: murein hydrolase activator EnvC family protein [Sarcina sp.]